MCLTAIGLTGCPISAGFASDAGADAGVGTGPDAGAVDAGATGSLSASLTTSNAMAQALAWNGSDFSHTSVDSTDNSGPLQVTLRAENELAGQFSLTLNNLIVGATSALWVSVSYQPSSGPDLWSCSQNGGSACSVAVTLTSYDGVTLAGSFSISFPADASLNTAQLTSPAFTVSLP